jgi:hypothetical protein
MRNLTDVRPWFFWLQSEFLTSSRVLSFFECLLDRSGLEDVLLSLIEKKAKLDGKDSNDGSSAFHHAVIQAKKSGSILICS